MTLMPSPIFLLADSQLLFQGAREGGPPPVLTRVRSAASAAGRALDRAAYVGASNGDDPRFYALFVAAMERANVTRLRSIPAEPSGDDERFVGAADVVVLAGGDVARGWSAFRRSGLVSRVVACRERGAVLIGISAGAVQLGAFGSSRGAGGGLETFATWGLAPYVVGAHEEPEWRELDELTRLAAPVPGLGVPLGGGAIVHPDLRLEAIGKPLVVLRVMEGAVERARIEPSAPLGR